MKLKKFAALALAGVMAVSMLAGCAGKGTDNTDKTETSGVTAEAVIAALGENTTKKVDFTYSSALESTLEKTVAYVGPKQITASTSLTNDDLMKFDKNLTEAYYFYAGTADEKYVKAATTVTYVTVSDDVAALNDNAVVKKLASLVDNATVYEAQYHASDLPAYADNNNQNYTDSEGNQYYYTFKYTGNMAVTKVVNGDAVRYAVAFTITRTPTKAAVPTKG